MHRVSSAGQVAAVLHVFPPSLTHLLAPCFDCITITSGCYMFHVTCRRTTKTRACGAAWRRLSGRRAGRIRCAARPVPAVLRRPGAAERAERGGGARPAGAETAGGGAAAPACSGAAAPAGSSAAPPAVIRVCSVASFRPGCSLGAWTKSARPGRQLTRKLTRMWSGRRGRRPAAATLAATLAARVSTNISGACNARGHAERTFPPSVLTIP